MIGDEGGYRTFYFILLSSRLYQFSVGWFYDCANPFLSESILIIL